jgi:hypothetical protein
MDPFIVVVGLLLIVFGTAAALVWWRLVKRAAPYQDEQSEHSGSNTRGDSEVIVLPPTGAAKPGARSEP